MCARVLIFAGGGTSATGPLLCRYCSLALTLAIFADKTCFAGTVCTDTPHLYRCIPSALTLLRCIDAAFLHPSTLMRRVLASPTAYPLTTLLRQPLVSANNPSLPSSSSPIEPNSANYPLVHSLLMSMTQFKYYFSYLIFIQTLELMITISHARHKLTCPVLLILIL